MMVHAIKVQADVHRVPEFQVTAEELEGISLSQTEPDFTPSINPDEFSREAGERQPRGGSGFNSNRGFTREDFASDLMRSMCSACSSEKRGRHDRNITDSDTASRERDTHLKSLRRAPASEGTEIRQKVPIDSEEVVYSFVLSGRRLNEGRVKG
ncbi:hypothetical protein KOW79_006092 [Hemibagrus wyckioides]|uniref:Uncharacterized protein n=1 Tax=Hemibagrus wyckioides TaxID=337641 RepID=A0A9D3SNL4_9TELE|nr:hypothetical protein KOW79_006092 [Hemibagrus wyckioides]